jgi:hypothetical protein
VAWSSSRTRRSTLGTPVLSPASTPDRELVFEFGSGGVDACPVDRRAVGVTFRFGSHVVDRSPRSSAEPHGRPRVSGGCGASCRVGSTDSVARSHPRRCGQLTQSTVLSVW